MEVNTKIILSIVGVALLLVVFGFAQGSFGEFLAIRAPIPEERQDPDAVAEYTILCEEACAVFRGDDLVECTVSCHSLGEETFQGVD